MTQPSLGGGRGPVVVLSHPGDLHATTVLDRLRSWDVPAVLFDASDLPTRQTLTIDHTGRRPGLRLRHAEHGTVDLSEVRSVWWRRPQVASLDAVADADARGFCHGEWHEALHGFYSLLDCPWMNPLVADQTASHKALQLAVAPRFGLRVPATLMTSDADEARAFVGRLGPGRVVYKIFAATYQVWRETRVLTPADLAHLDRLHLAPVIFQELVPGVADVRVTVVGDELYAMAIDGRGSDDVDFRLRMGQASTSAVTLPDDVAAGLRQLMAHFGLVYGGADFRLTPDGEYVFLEVNPAGEFLFCEHGAGHPLTDAVAGWLAGPTPGVATQPTLTTSTAASSTPGSTG